MAAFKRDGTHAPVTNCSSRINPRVCRVRVRIRVSVRIIVR